MLKKGVRTLLEKNTPGMRWNRPWIILKKLYANKAIVTLVKTIVAMTLLFLVVQNVELEEIVKVFYKVDFTIALFALTLHFLRIHIMGIRWKILLGKSINASTLKLTQIILAGQFFAFLIPSLIGVDATRGFYLNQENPNQFPAILNSMIAEKIISLASLFMIFIISIPFGVGILDVQIFNYVIAFGGILILLMLFFLFLVKKNMIQYLPKNKIRALLAPYSESLKEYFSKPKGLPLALIYSIIAQFIGILIVFLVAKSLNEHYSIVYFIILVPVAWIVSMIPITPNGLGLREGAFIFLFASFGMSKESTIAISTILLTYMIIIGLVGWVSYLNLTFQNRKKNKVAVIFDDKP